MKNTKLMVYVIYKDILTATMNCLATTESSLDFIETVVMGDRFVIYPLHIPRRIPKGGRAWGRTMYPHYDGAPMLHGNSPIFVEVDCTSIKYPDRYSSCISRVMYCRHLTPIPGISAILEISIAYDKADKEWMFSVRWYDYVSRKADVKTYTYVSFAKPMVGIIRRNVFCENILAAHKRHTERAMMREILVKKMCDARAVDMIAREFFPLM